MANEPEKPKLVTPFWRVMAGVLAAVALVVAGARFYYATQLTGGPNPVYLLRIVFPLLLGLFFGFIALTGRIPGLGGEK